MHTNVFFHRLCAPEYVQLIVPVPSLDMQFFPFQRSMVHTCSLEQFFLFGIAQYRHHRRQQLPFACIERERGMETTSFSQFKNRNIIHRKLLSYWLSALFLWYSIFTNAQKIIKCHQFQVSHRLILWRYYFPVSPFTYKVWEIRMHHQLL